MKKDRRKIYRKRCARVLSALLVGCMLMTHISVPSVDAQNAEFQNVTTTTTAPSWLAAYTPSETNQAAWQYQISGSRVRVTHTDKANGTQRIRVEQVYQPKEMPMNFVMEDIQASNTNYSIVIAIGKIPLHWYDQPGYLLIYDADGDFAIVESKKNADGSAVNPNGTPVHHVKSGLPSLTNGSDFSLQIQLVDDEYQITVNDYTCSVSAATSGDNKCPVSGPEEVYLVFGMMSGFQISSGKISGLQYHQRVNTQISFTLDKNVCSQKTETVRDLKPLAKYDAVLGGYSDGTFKPNQNLSRREAIVAVANLITERSDIEQVYTSDFTDISEEDADYDVFAYMQRSDFLPDFGMALEPDKGITRGEFMELLYTEDKMPNVSEKNQTLTRGEASKLFCEYLGKDKLTAKQDVSFTDIAGHTYASYIQCAANESEVYEETIRVTNSGAEAIQSAVDQAVAFSKAKDARVYIELPDEVYRLDQPVTVDGSKYGTYDVSIIIKGTDNRVPVITGNVDISGSAFSSVSGKNYYRYQLPEGAKVNGTWPKFRDLSLNGERLQLAKSDEKTFAKGHAVTTDGVTTYENRFYVDQTLLNGVTQSSVSTMELCMNIEWMHKRLRVNTIDTANAVEEGVPVSVKDEDWSAYVTGDGNKSDAKGWTYWLENHIALLDEAGEFYYDDTNGIIYVYPYSDGLGNAVISYPAVERLFDIQGCYGVTFEGLELTGTTSNTVTEHGMNGGLGGTSQGGVGGNLPLQAAAIYGEDTSHIAVRNCTFRALGSHGVFLNNGNRHVTVKGSSFTDLAMSAVILGNQNKRWSVRQGQSNVLLDNNYVTDIGTDYPGSPAIGVSYVRNIAITHNSILHTPYSGIMLGWMNSPLLNNTVSNAEVAYNKCIDNLYAMNDGAALYFCGANGLVDDTTVYNRAHDNYIQSNAYRGTYNGIYLDMNLSNYSVYHNVIDGITTSHGPVFNQSIAAQITYNNKVWENYTTMSPITDCGAAAKRNIQVWDNEMVASAEYLPAKARAIVSQAGQKSMYSGSIPKRTTEIQVDVAKPHITLTNTKEVFDDCVVFTITNNDTKAHTYTVKDLTGSVFTLESDSLTLQAGQSGKIACKVYCSDKKTFATYYGLGFGGQSLKLKVVREDGWSKVYQRVMEVRVGFALAREGYPELEYQENGVKLTYKKGATHKNYMGVSSSYYVGDTGAYAKLTDISSFWNMDKDYSIGVMIGNTAGSNSKWLKNRGYMIIYGRSGYFSIVKIEGEDIDTQTVLLSEKREELGGSLSVHVRLVDGVYDIMVNGKSYQVQPDLLTKPESIDFTFGIFGEKTSDTDQYAKDVSGWTPIYFTISEVGISCADELTVGTEAEGKAYIYVCDGDALPTGYYGDKYIIGWKLKDTQTACTKYESAKGAAQYVAEYVDRDMLRVAAQKSYVAEGVYRFIGSVDDKTRYKSSGFVMSNKESNLALGSDGTITAPESESVINWNNTGKYYSGVKAQLEAGKEAQVITAKQLYGDNTQGLFVKAFKFNQDVLSVPVLYIRAYVVLEDAGGNDVVVYGNMGVLDRTAEVYPEEDDKDFVEIE